MDDHPPSKLEDFDALLAAQPPAIRALFSYALCLLMVEAGRMIFVETISDEGVPLAIFRVPSGERFAVPRPQLSDEQLASLVANIREIADAEGWL